MDEDKDKDKQEEEKGEGEKLVAYKLMAPLGDNAAGDVIYVPEDVGDALVKAGHAEMASADDMGGEGEEMEDMGGEEPVVANSVSRLAKKIEEKAVAAVAKHMGRTRAQSPQAIAATPRVLPFRSNGDYIRTLAKAVQAQGKGKTLTTEWNKIAAWQDEAVRNFDKMGIQVKSPLGVNETTNSQGGYLVNPQFSKDVYAIDHGQFDLAGAAGVQIDAESNIFNQRYINESSLANGSIFGGLNMAATSEGASFTSSLPAWNNLTLQLQKFAIFVYYTSEVLEDASYPLESEVNEYCNKAFLYGINGQIFQGATLEGFLNTPALVTVTSSTNDTAWHTTPSTNLTYADLANIWSSVYPESQVSDSGVWLFHPSLANPLTQMTYTFSGSNPAWGIQYDAQRGLEGRGPGVVGTPYQIFGKRAYPSWACSAPGVAGDIMYVDLATVIHYKKAFRVEVSRDYQFGSDQVAVRFVWRGDVKTRFRNKITGPNGTEQFSALVTRTGVGT